MVYRFIGQLAKNRYYNKTHGIRFDRMMSDYNYMRNLGRRYRTAVVNRNTRVAGKAVGKWRAVTAKRRPRNVRGVSKYGGKPSPGTPKLMILGRRKSRGGASNSKSKGFFRSGTSRKQTLDYFGKAGVVFSQEYGSVLKDETAGPYMQSATVGHANFSLHNLYAVISFALTKMIASKAKRQMVDINDIIELSAQGNMSLVLYYRKNTFSTTTFSNFVIVAGTTRWYDIARWFYDLCNTTFTTTTQLISLRLNDSVREATPAADAFGIVIFNLDMTKCRIQLYSKSALKLQNRTINTSGNDEADDVDNVPLYGKSYEGLGNYAIYKVSEQQHAALNMCNIQINTSDPIFGSGKYKYPIGEYKWYGSLTVPGGADSLVEPAVQSQFSHVRKVGKAHLDPAEIKTSVLTFNKSYNLNVLIRSVSKAADDANEVGQSLDHPIGKYRFFILEKMIQAVNSTDVNGIKLAYEVDCKTACICTAPTQTTTSYIIDQMPL